MRKAERNKADVVGKCCQERGELCGEKSEKDEGWEEKDGKAKRRWEDCVRGDMENETADRKRWREKIHTADPT